MENKIEEKKKGNFNLKNLSKEQKNKFAAYTIFGVAFCGILIYGISNYTSDEKNEEVTEFSNPEAEQSKYNSKLEAINPKTPVQSSNSLETTFAPSDNISNENSDVDLQKLDRQLSELGSNKTVDNEPKTNSGVAPTNSHNVYGNYSMWQDKEPSNNKIGYSNKKNSATYQNTPLPRQTTTPSYSEVSSYRAEPTVPKEAPIFGNEEKKAVSILQIKSKLISQGEATNGRSISFVLLDNFTLNGETFSKSKSYAIGTIKIENNRILAKINTLKANGKTYNVVGKIIGYDGDDGLPFSISEDSRNNTGEVLKDEGGRIVSSIPVVGGVLSRATNGSSRSRAKSVTLSGNIECTILIYK